MATEQERPKIIIAEDDDADQLLAEEALKCAGMAASVVFVDNGDDLLRVLQSCKSSEKGNLPKLVLADLNMPRKDGLEALAEIRADDVLGSLPVVIFTGSESDKDRQRALELGASGFVVKPSNFEALVQIMTALKEAWFDRETEATFNE